MQSISRYRTSGSILIIAFAGLIGACGDDTVSSASATDSGTDSSTSETGTTSTTTATGSASQSASATQGSDSQTGDVTSDATTTTTTTGVTTSTTTSVTSETGTTTVDPTTTGDTTGVDPTTTTDTTGDTTTTTGDTTGDSTTTGDTTTGGEVLPGSCRASEYYGSAGGYPAFNDPNYAAFKDKQVAISTTSTQATSYVLHIVDISGAPPPANLNYAAPRYNGANWTVGGLGRIFGLTLDSDGNIYVAATTVYGGTSNPGHIKKIDAITGEITTFANLPNNGPAIGNLNYDCVSQSIYATNHEDGRIYQYNIKGALVSTYRHSDKDVTLGAANDPGEPNGQFVPLGERLWGVQSHAGRLYYSVWWEDNNRPNAKNNEIWSVAYVDQEGVPDGATAKLEFSLPDGLLNPVSDITFAQSGRMILGRRTMTGDTSSLAHSSNVLAYDYVGGAWTPKGDVYKVGEITNSSAGGVDHDFAADGYVWCTGDAIDFYTPNVVYGLQGVPYSGGDITVSTLIDLDGNIVSQAKTAQGDVEVPIPLDAAPVMIPE